MTFNRLLFSLSPVFVSTPACFLSQRITQFKKDYYEREVNWVRRNCLEALLKAFAEAPDALDAQPLDLAPSSFGLHADASDGSGLGGSLGGGMLDRLGSGSGAGGGGNRDRLGSDPVFGPTPWAAVLPSAVPDLATLAATALAPGLLRALFHHAHAALRRCTVILGASADGQAGTTAGGGVAGGSGGSGGGSGVGDTVVSGGHHHLQRLDSGVGGGGGGSGGGGAGDGRAHGEAFLSLYVASAGLVSVSEAIAPPPPPLHPARLISCARALAPQLPT